MCAVALRGLKGRLVTSSIDAYTLALETVNRLGIRYRLESFNYLVINAWELLLKAKIIHDTGNPQVIFYPRRRGHPKKTLSISDCIRTIYPNQNDHIRRNLEFLEQERHKSTHLVLDVIPPDILAVYQACVVNYHNALEDWFGINLASRLPVGMMTIVFDLSEEKVDLRNALLRRRLGSDTTKYLLHRQQQLEQTQSEIGTSKEFAAEINIDVSVAKNRNKADVSLVGGSDGEPVMVIKKPRDPSETHPYYTKMAAAEITARLENLVQLSQHDIFCINVAHRIFANGNYYYRGGMPDSRAQFSEAFIEWVVGRIRTDPDFCRKAREELKRLRTEGPGQSIRTS